MKIGSLRWLFGRNSEFWPTNMKTGMWAWVGHRITGLVLVAYVFMHLSFITTASVGSGDFDSLMEITSQPLFVAMDFLLIVVVIYHAMNGARVIMFDLGIGVRHQKFVFWVCMAVAAVLVMGGIWAIWDLIFVPSGGA